MYPAEVLVGVICIGDKKRIKTQNKTKYFDEDHSIVSNKYHKKRLIMRRSLIAKLIISLFIILLCSLGLGRGCRGGRIYTYIYYSVRFIFISSIFGVRIYPTSGHCKVYFRIISSHSAALKVREFNERYQ